MLNFADFDLMPLLAAIQFCLKLPSEVSAITLVFLFFIELHSILFIDSF